MRAHVVTAGSRPASPAGRLWTLLFVFALLGPAAAAAAEEGFAPGSSLAAFEKLYAEVEQAVAGGQLPASAGTEAADHRFELEKDLIRADAEIEVLKLEAGRYSGARQAETLDRLVAAAAAREQRLCVAIRQLEELGGMSAELAAAEAAVAAGVEEQKEGGFQITFEAEDLVDDPDS